MSISIPTNPNGAATTANSQPVNIASDQTVAVSISSSTLPTGAATAALQTSGNASLTTIATNIPALGQALAAASVPVVLTAAQLTTLTPLSTVAATQSGTWNITNVSGTVSLPAGASTSALQTTGNTSVASIDTKTPALGQALAAASVPVVLTAAQLTTLTPPAAITGFNLETTQAKLPIAQGTALGANSGPMVQGSVTTAAPTYTTGQISPLSLDTTGSLRVTFTGGVTSSENLAQVNGQTVNVGIGAAGTGTQRVSVSNDSNILATQSGTWNITNVSGTVSLPTGASTSALQTTGNTSVASIDTKTPALGQALAAASVPVVLTAAQLTTITPPAAITGFALDTSVNTLLKPASTLAAVTTVTTVSAVTAITNALPTGGNTIGNVNQTIGTAGFGKVTDGTNTATVKAASTAPVATDTALVVSLSPNSPSAALPTGAATSANQTTLGNQTTKINDGTTTGTIKAASTAAVAADTALVVALSPNNNTLANSLFIKNTDGTNVVAVKAASTTAAATDPALVVQISQNSPGGGIFNTTQPTLANLGLSQAQVTTRGALIIERGVENVVANSWFTKVSDGTNTATVKAASTAPVTTDTALVVTLSPNSPSSALPTGAATSALQSTGNTSLANLDVALSTRLKPADTLAGVTTVTTVSAVTAITNALPAGTNLMGKVGIDQTTVGTTNAISIAQIGATTVVNGGLAGTLGIGGTQAQNTAITANPIITGGVARTTTLPTAVTQGNSSQIQTDKFGRAQVGAFPRELLKTATIALPATTTETTFIAAVAATFNDIYMISIGNSGTNARFDIRDATAGTVRISQWMGGNGVPIIFPTPIPQQTANANWTVQASVAGAGGFITVYYLPTT